MHQFLASSWADRLHCVVCHPSTSTPVATKATQLLRRIINRFEGTTSQAFDRSPLFSIDDLIAPIVRLGFEKALTRTLDEKASLMDVDEWEDQDEGSEVNAKRFNVTREKRDVVVMRWARIVQDLAETA